VNQVLEAARRAGFLGSGLEARVLLHVGDAGLAAGLARLQQARPRPPARAVHRSPRARLRTRAARAQADNGADPLRYVFFVSAVELAPSAAAAAAADHSAAADVEGLGAVTVGVARARGAKCQRCAWRRARRFSDAWPHASPGRGGAQVLELQRGGRRGGRPPAALRALRAGHPRHGLCAAGARRRRACGRPVRGVRGL